MSLDNIYYHLTEKNEINEILDIQKISRVRNDSICSESSFDGYFSFKNNEQNFSMKKLMLIFEYYELTKFTKINSKSVKKNELLEILFAFESDPANFEIVRKRKRMWNCIELLKKDKILKRVVLW